MPSLVIAGVVAASWALDIGWRLWTKRRVRLHPHRVNGVLMLTTKQPLSRTQAERIRRDLAL